MKKLLPILFVSLLAQGVPVQQQAIPTASIEGTVVRIGTGETLSKASVELVSVGPPGTFSTTTESDGRFYFPNIPAGTYRLLGRRDGYWNAEFGQRWVDGPGQTLTVGAGLQLRDVPLVMTPGGVIAGRIIGRDGRPLAGARVRAMKPWIDQNQRPLRVVQEVVANDLGEFRLIWLMPGRYYLSATYVNYSPAAAASQLIIDPDAAPGLANGTRSVSRQVTSGPLPNGLEDNEVFTPIYFPTTLESDKAIAIELKQGEEYRGADINLSPVRAFHVRGTVTNLPPPPDNAARGPRAGNVPPAPGAGARGGPQVRLTPTSPNGSQYGTASDAETGRFDFQRVVAGGYVAYLFMDGMTIRTPVEVRNGDVDGLALQMASGINIPVNITLEGTPPKNMPAVTNLIPTLWRNPTLLGAPPMPATAGNPPILRNIAPGSYHVYLTPLLGPLRTLNPVDVPPVWQSAYVKSMRMGDVDVLTSGLHLERQGDTPLQIVIGVNPGTLEGQVLNEVRQPIGGAYVTLFANNPADRLYRTDMYKVVGTDNSGRFRVQGLGPGEYRVFAWENVERGTWLDATFLRLNEERGTTIRIEEGQVQAATLPIISVP
ncbi:MAG TPA: carboxypeptidase regulatory-like domain-containing protein [Terriglobia bacterium]|nr:carboxypeptidase regulatory-like domain-containing protein [Terriglobia bacterium]